MLGKAWYEARQRERDAVDFEEAMLMVKFLRRHGVAGSVLESVNEMRELCGRAPFRTLEEALREHIRNEAQAAKESRGGRNARWSACEWMASRIMIWIDDDRRAKRTPEETKTTVKECVPSFLKNAKAAMNWRDTIRWRGGRRLGD